MGSGASSNKNSRYAELEESAGKEDADTAEDWKKLPWRQADTSGPALLAGSEERRHDSPLAFQEQAANSANSHRSVGPSHQSFGSHEMHGAAASGPSGTSPSAGAAGSSRPRIPVAEGTSQEVLDLRPGHQSLGKKAAATKKIRYRECVAAADWSGSVAGQLSVKEGDRLDMSEVNGDMALCKTTDGKEGWLPRAYLKRPDRDAKAMESHRSGGGLDAGKVSGRDGKHLADVSENADNSGAVVSADATQPTTSNDRSSASAGHSIHMQGASSSGSRSARHSTETQGATSQGDPTRSDDNAVDERNDDSSPLGETSAPDLPNRWTMKLANTMTLHTIQNAMRLAQYLMKLLTSGYGTVSALHIACWEGSLDAVVALTSGTSKMARDYHSRPGELTPLHIATLCGHCKVVEYLLECGINANIPTIHGICALHLAAFSGPELSEILLSSKANVSPRTNDADTPLHYACCYHQVPAIDVFLKAGSGAGDANSFGVTPLHIAAAHSGMAGARLSDAVSVLSLSNHGADPEARDKHGRTAHAIAEKTGADKSLLDFLDATAAHAQEVAAEMLGTADADSEPPPTPSDSGNEEDLDGLIGIARKDQEAQQFNPTRRARAGNEDMRLAEENTSLSSELARLKRELEASRSNEKSLRERLQNAQATMRSMQSVQGSPDAVAAPSSADAAETQQLRLELEQERTELGVRQDSLDEERRQWQEERAVLVSQAADAEAARAAAAEEARQLQGERDALSAKAEATEAAEADARAAAAESAADEAKRMEAELGEKASEIDKTQAEMKALQASLEQRTAEVEEARAKVVTQDGEITRLKSENTRLSGELARMTKQYEEAWRSLTELRKQHSTLREEHTALQKEKQQGEAASREKELALEGNIREHELRIQQLEQENADQAERLQEMDTMRKRAEYADRMLQPLEQRIEELHEAFEKEQAVRKRYHNQLQDAKGAIRVYARVRPVVKREAGQEVVVRKVDAFTMELDGNEKARKQKTFTFDSIFDDHSTQEQVFSECRSLVSSAIDGFNITVFAYGQTGAGKTHTMYGSAEHPGLVPRITEETFLVLNQYAHECNAVVRVSMFELYRDALIDLFLPRAQAKTPPPLNIKKDSRGSVYVENATERLVTCSEDFARCIGEGQDRRHVAATKMNAESSRSHLIVILVVESTNKKTKQVTTGKLTLCDLAGSERLKKSEVTGDAQKEAQSINKSLTALGDVIEALSKHAKFIPYRNHMLTKLLEDSIGGNAKTLMFVNCSPVAENGDETNSSLGYAARAKLIVNKVEKNQDSQEVARLKKVVQVMSQELEQARGPNHSSLPGAPGAAGEGDEELAQREGDDDAEADPD